MTVYFSFLFIVFGMRPYLYEVSQIVTKCIGGLEVYLFYCHFKTHIHAYVPQENEKIYIKFGTNTNLG